MNKQTSENYKADKAVSSENQDEFQRYGFAKRIAHSITSRVDKESIVFGLFGAWGEGKSSVINFIQKEVTEAGDGFIQVTFNPWRFTDEAALLTSFFNTWANEIKKSLPAEDEEKDSKWRWLKLGKRLKNNPESPLKTTKENLGDYIQKYGKVAAIFRPSGRERRNEC